MASFVMVIPIVKMVWLIFYYLGYFQELYFVIGHSLEYNAILLGFSFIFKFCLWHKILIFGCILSLIFEYAQSIGYFISVGVYDFAFFLFAIFVISTLIFFTNGRKIKKKVNIGPKGADK